MARLSAQVRGTKTLRATSVGRRRKAAPLTSFLVYAGLFSIKFILLAWCMKCLGITPSLPATVLYVELLLSFISLHPQFAEAVGKIAGRLRK